MIGQPLAFRAFQDAVGAFGVIDAKPCAVAHSEVELCKVAVQMPLAHVLVSQSLALASSSLSLSPHQIAGTAFWLGAS